MTINLSLSADSIASAVRKLEDARDNLMQGISDYVDTMVSEGADVANSAYGSLATAWGIRDDSNDEGVVNGHIGVSGDPDAVIIAEFGAGDATVPNEFENAIPGVEVYAGEYSEKKGSGEYAKTLAASGGETGFWHFGGRVYHEVEPRRGLAKAKAFIVVSSDNYAEEMIHL